MRGRTSPAASARPTTDPRPTDSRPLDRKPATLRPILIRDQADRDAIASQLIRYRDGHRDDWAEIIGVPDDVAVGAASDCAAAWGDRRHLIRHPWHEPARHVPEVSISVQDDVVEKGNRSNLILILHGLFSGTVPDRVCSLRRQFLKSLKWLRDKAMH
jgi:hypothetical protein